MLLFFLFSILCSLQADNLSDTHSDTHKQVPQLPLAMTWETHLDQSSAHQKINLGSKEGFSIINYPLPLSGRPLFYLLFPSSYPSLFYPISCVYLSNSFSRSLSAFLTSRPSHRRWWMSGYLNSALSCLVGSVPPFTASKECNMIILISVPAGVWGRRSTM